MKDFPGYICNFQIKPILFLFRTGTMAWNIPKNKKEDMIISEDLFVPGFFEVEAKKGDSIVFSASTKEEKPSG